MGTSTAPLRLKTSETTMTRCHKLPLGAELQPDGEVRFRQWAPAMAMVELAIEGRTGTLPMAPQAEGWHQLITKEAHSASCYRFVLEDGRQVPDLASRFQPEDVHGPGEVVDPESYAWHDVAWSNRPWSEAVMYELHVGTIWQEGTPQGGDTLKPWSVRWSLQETQR